jgi:hypothetical protein
MLAAVGIVFLRVEFEPCEKICKLHSPGKRR